MLLGQCARICFLSKKESGGVKNMDDRKTVLEVGRRQITHFFFYFPCWWLLDSKLYIEYNGAWEMAQVVRYLPCKQEDQSLGPSTHVRTQWSVVIIPTLEKRQQSDLLGLLLSQPSLLSEFKVNEILFFKNKADGSSRNTTWSWPLTSINRTNIQF